MTWKTTTAGDSTSTSQALACGEWSETRETGKQLRRFLIVGALCVLTDLLVYTPCVRLELASVATAKAISYLAGVAVGFVLNKRWTFESRRQGLREPASYLALYATTLVVNVACNHWALEVLGSHARPIAFLLATAASTVLNFLGMRWFAFRKGIEERRLASQISEGNEAGRRFAA